MDKKVYEFISKQMNDPIIERRTCAWTGEKFAIYQGDVDLLDKISPVIGGKKMDIPFPTLSPLARMRRRMMFRNERGLYMRQSALSGKKVISMYHPDMVRDVVLPQEIYSNEYDPLSWGISFDAQVPFFAQYRTLQENIARPGTIAFNNLNGDYNVYSSDNKNIYLCADAMRSEDTLYATTVKQVKNGVDLLNVWESDYVYESVSSHHLTKCIQAWYCEHCYDCGFITTCKNCTNCFLCSNLSDKQNHILNKPASKEEIATFKSMMRTHTGMQKIKEQFEERWDTEPRPASWVINSEHSCGSVLSNSQNAFMCFDSHDLQNCRYCIVGEFNTDCMDCSIFNPNASQAYEQVCGGYQISKSAFNTTCRQSSETYLSEFILNGNHMLGCINMQNADHCILNKKYPKEERETIAKDIIEGLQQEGSRGEFFDTTFCPFPYNDTVAMDYFPIHTVIGMDGKKEIIDAEGTGTVYLLEDAFIARAELDLGGKKRIPIHRRTQNYEINIPEDAKIIQAKDLPDSIDDADDDICNYVILCEQTGRPYRITPIELKIYRALGISLPRLHHSIRHTQRIKRRAPRGFMMRNCDATGEEVLSVYPPGTKYKVYNQKAFEKLLYG